MNGKSDNSFIVCTRDGPEVEWLAGVLDNHGKVIQAVDLEEALHLIEMLGAAIVFVTIDHRYQPQQCTLIESLLEARPMVSVVAVGDGADSELVIAAMRAGARDFVPYGLRGSEVVGLVRRLLERMPALPIRADQAQLTMIHNARPDPDAALVATHVATELAKNGHNTLLIDIGVPPGESLAILGLECNFHFDDALRNLRRLDKPVIESAFARYDDTALRILPQMDDTFSLASCQSAEVFLLLGALKQHFDQIVVNSSGQPDCSLLRSLAADARQLFWHVDQSVPCSRRNLALLHQWRADGIKVDHARLLIDRYLAREAPDAATLEESYAMPLAATLPPVPELRLRSRNEGVPVTWLAPRDTLSRNLIRLSREASEPRFAGKRGLINWVRRMAR